MVFQGYAALFTAVSLCFSGVCLKFVHSGRQSLPSPVNLTIISGKMFLAGVLDCTRVAEKKNPTKRMHKLPRPLASARGCSILSSRRHAFSSTACRESNPCASGLGITALRHPCRRRRTRGPFPFCVPRTVFKANSSPSPKPRSPLCPLPEPPCLPQSGSNRSLTGAPEIPSPGTSLGPRDQRPGTIRSAPARGRVARSCTDNVGKAGHPRTPAAETEFKSEQRGLFHTEGSAGEDASCPLCFLLRGETSAPEPSLCP